MRIHLLIGAFAAAILAAPTSFAEVVGKDAIPEKIMANFTKKHPNAFDVTALPKKHFGQDVYLLIFKEGDEKLITVYRAGGAFFVSGVVIDPSGMLPAATFDSLKAEFKEYEIKEAILVVNPNGPGEEFDLTVASQGSVWNVSIDGEGKISSKEP